MRRAVRRRNTALRGLSVLRAKSLDSYPASIGSEASFAHWLMELS
ncbi:MAG: hypothetical protein RL434_11 [Pseudomonadota bacterium]|jgi:hypothetical protein